MPLKNITKHTYKSLEYFFDYLGLFIFIIYTNLVFKTNFITGLTLQKRWKNIRTSFARELKRQKNYGSGANRKSEYVYYKQLRFLSNVMNIAEKEADDEPEYVYYDVDVEFNQTSDDNKYEQRIENKFKRKMIDDEDTIDDNEDNEDRLFLLSLHERLRRIPKSKKTAIKIKLLSVINEALIDEVAD